MGTFLSSGKVRGSHFLEWVGGPREARSWPSKSWRRELSMDPTLVKAAAAGGGGRRPAFTRVGSIDDNRGRVYASLRLGLSPDLARGRGRLAPAPDGERPSASVEAPWGMRFLCGFSTGWRLTMTFGAAPRSRGCGKRRASLRRYGGALSPSFSTTNPSASPQGAKTPKRSAHPSRLDENAFFLLTKETPYKGWGEGGPITTTLIRRLAPPSPARAGEGQAHPSLTHTSISPGSRLSQA